MDALTSLIREDATQSMPPYRHVAHGPRRHLHAGGSGPGGGCRGSRVIPVVSANGAPAFGQYKPSDAGDGYEPWALQVLEIEDGRIVELTFFLDTETVFPLFGLPPRLDAWSARATEPLDAYSPCPVIPVLAYDDVAEACAWLAGRSGSRSGGGPGLTARSSPSRRSRRITEGPVDVGRLVGHGAHRDVGRARRRAMRARREDPAAAGRLSLRRAAVHRGGPRRSALDVLQTVADVRRRSAAPSRRPDPPSPRRRRRAP